MRVQNLTSGGTSPLNFDHVSRCTEFDRFLKILDLFSAFRLDVVPLTRIAFEEPRSTVLLSDCRQTFVRKLHESTEYHFRLIAITEEYLRLHSNIEVLDIPKDFRLGETSQ